MEIHFEVGGEAAGAVVNLDPRVILDQNSPSRERGRLASVPEIFYARMRFLG
jgi:hypothetical protein